MIRALIFDFDGTLSNRQANAYAVFDDYFRPFFSGFSEVEYEAVLQDMMLYDCNGILNVDKRVIPFVNKYGRYLPEDFAEKFVPYYNDQMFEYTVLKEETVDVLEQLKGRYKMAVLSNGDSLPQHRKVEKMELEHYFEEVLVSGDIGIDKPDRGIFDHLCKKLGVRNEETVMIGDVFASDILGASRAGLIPVWLNSDPELPARHYHGYQIRELKELLPLLETIEGGH